MTRPGGTYFNNRWYPDIPVIPDGLRTMPSTVPDSEIAKHRAACQCDPCSAYSTDLRRRLIRAHIRSLGSPPAARQRQESTNR